MCFPVVAPLGRAESSDLISLEKRAHSLAVLGAAVVYLLLLLTQAIKPGDRSAKQPQPPVALACRATSCVRGPPLAFLPRPPLHAGPPSFVGFAAVATASITTPRTRGGVHCVRTVANHTRYVFTEPRLRQIPRRGKGGGASVGCSAPLATRPNGTHRGRRRADALHRLAVRELTTAAGVNKLQLRHKLVAVLRRGGPLWPSCSAGRLPVDMLLVPPATAIPVRASVLFTNGWPQRPAGSVELTGVHWAEPVCEPAR